VYDGKEAGCPLCLQEDSQPRAAPRQKDTPKPPSAILGYFMVLLVLAGVGYGAYWYFVLKNRPSEAVLARAAQRANAAAVMAESHGDTSKFVDPDDLTPVKKARALKTALDALLTGQRGALLAFTDGPVDTAATDRAERRRARDYATFAKRWHERLDAATRDGSEFTFPPGTRLGPQMETINNQFGAALSVLRDMVPRDQVRPRATRQEDADEAASFLNAAGRQLTNLPK
jgi:hypothetical protein